MNVHFDRFVLSLKDKFEALRMSVFRENSDPPRGQAWGEVVFAHEVAAQLLRSRRCQDGLRWAACSAFPGMELFKNIARQFCQR